MNEWYDWREKHTDPVEEGLLRKADERQLKLRELVLDQIPFPELMSEEEREALVARALAVAQEVGFIQKDSS